MILIENQVTRRLVSKNGQLDLQKSLIIVLCNRFVLKNCWYSVETVMFTVHCNAVGTRSGILYFKWDIPTWVTSTKDTYINNNSCTCNTTPAIVDWPLEHPNIRPAASIQSWLIRNRQDALTYSQCIIINLWIGCGNILQSVVRQIGIILVSNINPVDIHKL